MSITDCYPMRKRRSVDKTPKRSKSSSVSNGGRLQETPRRITSNTSFTEQGLEIIWDNSSPSPTRTLNHGKRKKHTESDSSSSGGEISDLVKKLADKTGQTPETNALLNYWMQREEKPDAEKKEGEEENPGVTTKTSKKKAFQTPARRSRRGQRRGNRAKVKQLTKELELLAAGITETENEGISTKVRTPTKVTSTSKGQTEKKPLSARVKTGPPLQIKANTNSPNHNACNKTTTCDKQFESTANIADNNTMCCYGSLAPELEDLDWTDDDDDMILSQVDISAFCNTECTETQVFTNTQLLGSAEESKLPKDIMETTPESSTDLNDSFVTESWDLTDEFGDEENLLLDTLEEIERTQRRKDTDVLRSLAAPVIKNNVGCRSIVDMVAPVASGCKSKSKYSREDIERKKLEAQQKRQQVQSQKSQRDNSVKTKRL